MTTLIYAGIGARATPGPVLADMTKMAAWLARTGWNLAAGGARGADTAFAGGTPAGPGVCPKFCVRGLAGIFVFRPQRAEAGKRSG